MAINIITGFLSSSREQLDKRSGPYVSTAAALAALDTNSRVMGMPIYVIADGTTDAAGNYITGTVQAFQFTGGIEDDNFVEIKYGAGDFAIFGNRNSEYEVSEDTLLTYTEGSTQEEIITSLNSTIQGGVHGFRYVQKYESLYAVNRDGVSGQTNVYVFSNLDDLSDYTTITINSGGTYTGTEQIIYSSYTDKLYFALSDGGFTLYENMLVYEIDPSDNTATQVLNHDIFNNYGIYYVAQPSITVLDNYLYISVGYYFQELLKISLDDFSVDSTVALPLGSTELHHNMLTDGEKIYISTIIPAGNATSPSVFRIDPSDLSTEDHQYVPHVVSDTANGGGFSDDGTIIGNYLYFQTEGFAKNGIYKIAKSDLTDHTLLQVPLNNDDDDLWACYFDGIWIWYSGDNGNLGKYSPETNEVYSYSNPFTYNINEIRTDGQRILVAGFDSYPVTNTGYVGRTAFPTEPIKKVILDSTGAQVLEIDYTGTLNAEYINASENISAVLFQGELSGTISNNTTAITQSANNNSTLVATTEYVDTAASEVFANTAARHSHSNKTILDKFGEDNSGNPTYNSNLIDTTIAQRDVYDSLDSSDNTISLSAKQGKVLKDLIDALPTQDTNTQLSDSDIAAFGYIKTYTDTNTQLSDSDIAAFGYIKTDTNTQRTDAEIDARIALNPEGFLTSYVDTNTQLSDSDIAALGYIKTDTNTQLTDAEIASFGYIKTYTDTNTQRSDEDIRDVASAQWVNGTNTTVVKNDSANTIKINSTDTNTQLSDGDIASMGYIKTYTDTNTQLSNEQVQDIVGAMVSSNTESNISVTYNDASGKLNFSATDTNTQLSDSDIGAMGYIKTYTDTNTQLSNEQVQDIVGLMVSSNTETNISVTYNDSTGKLNFASTDTNTNTQRTDEEIRDVAASQWIDGTNTTVVFDDANNTIKINATDTNTQRGIHDTPVNGATTTSISSNWAFDNVKTAVPSGAVFTDTQLSDADITALGYIKTDTDTNTQLSTEEVQDIMGATWTDGTNTTVVYDDTNGTLKINSVDTNTFRGIHDTPVDGATTTSISSNWAFDNVKTAVPSGAVFTDTNTQLSDADITALGYIKTDTNTQRSNEEIRDLAAGQWIDGTNTTVVYDDSANTIKINSTNTNTQLSTEEVQDIMSATWTDGTNTTVVYDDTNGTLKINSTNTNTTYSTASSSTLGLVKIGYTESGKNYPVELSSGKMYVNVPWTDTDTNTTYTSGDFTHDDLDGFVANEHIDWTADQGTTNIHSGNYSNTQLSTEQVQDIVGAMFSGNTETRVSATYQDNDGTIDLVVDDMNANTTYVSSDFTHDDLTGFVANEHIDWTVDQGSTNIHSSNYTNTNTNQLTTFQVEDGDGTEVTISHAKEWKFTEGQGINVNWTDTSTGSDGDPFDLQFALKANGVRANELNVSGNGTSGQYLASDGDGSFSWVTPPAIPSGNSIIDWTTDQGATNIHANNITGYLKDTTDTFDGTLTITGGSLGVEEGQKIILDQDGDSFANIFYDTDGTGYMIYNSVDQHHFKNGDDGQYDVVKAGSFVKDGGTSSQFLKADGTVDSNTYLTSSSTQSKYLRSDQSDTTSGTLTATNFILSSDGRLKENVEEVDNKSINVDWKTFEMKSNKGQKRYGVIAQELEEVHPEFVRTDDEGMKSVAYVDLLIAKIAELEARLKKIEK